MAAIYQELELEWRGETYRVTPTYRTIQRIEQKISIAATVARIGKGEPPVSQIADIVAILLHQAGAKDVNAEEIYADMMLDDGELFRSNSLAVMMAFMPQRDSGNAQAPSKTAGRKSEK